MDENCFISVVLNHWSALTSDRSDKYIMISISKCPTLLHWPMQEFSKEKPPKQVLKWGYLLFKLIYSFASQQICSIRQKVKIKIYLALCRTSLQYVGLASPTLRKRTEKCGWLLLYITKNFTFDRSSYESMWWIVISLPSRWVCKNAPNIRMLFVPPASIP